MYAVTAPPPSSSGASHEIVAPRTAVVAVMDRTIEGRLDDVGVTLAVPLGPLVPDEFTADTRNIYSVRAVKLVTVVVSAVDTPSAKVDHVDHVSPDLADNSTT